MKLPVEWLREYVETPLGDDALAAKLTMAGLEVEETTPSDDGPVFHTKVTPNRGDWLSVLGTAREAAAALDVPLRRPLPRRCRMRTTRSSGGRASVLRTATLFARASRARWSATSCSGLPPTGCSGGCWRPGCAR